MKPYAFHEQRKSREIFIFITNLASFLVFQDFVQVRYAIYWPLQEQRALKNVALCDFQL